MAKTANVAVRITGIAFVLLHSLHLVAHRKHRHAIALRGGKLIDLSADLREQLVNARVAHGDRKVYLSEKNRADLDKALLDYQALVERLKDEAIAALDANDLAFSSQKSAYNSAIGKANDELSAVHAALRGLDGYAEAHGTRV